MPQDEELTPIPKINGREVYDVANQLGGYVGPNTPVDLGRFLVREANAAAELADAYVALLARAERAEKERDAALRARARIQAAAAMAIRKRRGGGVQ